MSRLGLDQLVNYRWALPVVAELSANHGSKFVTLCKRLGVSRQSLRRTLAALIEHRLVAPNPGYGHPMRPEYILTGVGRAIGPAVEKLAGGVRALGVEATALQKWSLPVLHSIGGGADRFGAIRARWPSMTSRALSLTLKNLEQAGLLSREVTDAYPPTSAYALTPAGARLASLVSELQTALAR